MTGDEIARRTADLRQRLSNDKMQDHAEIHREMLNLIDALAMRLSEIDHSKQAHFRTSPEGETIDV